MHDNLSFTQFCVTAAWSVVGGIWGQTRDSHNGGAPVVTAMNRFTLVGACLLAAGVIGLSVWQLYHRRGSPDGVASSGSSGPGTATQSTPVRNIGPWTHRPDERLSGHSGESSNNPAPAEDLPQHIRQRLDDPSYHPRYGEVPVLSEKAEQELIGRFQRIYSITNKCHLAVVLAYGGGERHYACSAMP